MSENKKRIGCLGLILFLILCISLLGNLILGLVALPKVTSSGTKSSARHKHLTEVRVDPGSGKSKIALVELSGVISGSVRGASGGSMVDDIKIALDRAVSDDKVKAIIVKIDSPGGEVTASDVIYNAIKKARDEKPVVIYMGSMAASGGYYAACGGSYLMAHETSITGSIGVIIQSLNYEDLFGKIGLQSVVFKSGKFKDIMSGTREMTQAEKAYIQALVMQTYDKFVGIVSTERTLPLEPLKATLADGRIISGKDALENKLIDQVGYIEDAYAKARELGGADNAPVVRYEMPFQLGNIFRILGESRTNRVELSLSPTSLPKLESGRLYLLPEIMVP